MVEGLLRLAETLLKLAAIPFLWVLTLLRWIRKAWRMLRELRTHQRHIEAVRDVLAAELRANARILQDYEQEKLWLGQIQTMLKTARWHQTATEWSVLRSSNAELWNEIADAYEAIGRTKDTAAEPPTSAHVMSLAQRLSEAQI